MADRASRTTPPEELEERRLEGQVTMRLLKRRTVLLTGEINRRSSQRLIAELLLLSEEDPKEPIKLFINSQGGDADAGFAIFDVIRFIEAPVKAVCAGLAASAAVIVLLACPKERRLSLPNARFLIHQPSTGIRGSAADIQIEASEILKLREKGDRLISDETGQPLEKVKKDTHRNYWMSAPEARDYGLIGRIIMRSGEIESAPQDTHGATSSAPEAGA
jgi:ATP-dependent Clp protease protease subunit